MTPFAIWAEIRTSDEKTSQIRASKRVPGVVYGKNQSPISLSLDASEFLKLYRKAGESNIIELSVGKLKLDVLVHETQKHPVTGDFTHVDFFALTKGEAVHAKIHFNFVGASEAVKTEGAIVEESMKEIEVKCLPRDLVDHFDVDLSLLKNSGDHIRVSDIGIDIKKYELHGQEDRIIASAVLPRAAVVSDEAESTPEA